MPHSKLLLLLIALLHLQPLLANQEFLFNQPCRNAFQLTLSLRFQGAKAELMRERVIRPDNAIPHLIDNYIDFISILFTEDEALFQALKPKRAERLAALKNADPESPWYRFSQAEVMLQWAFLSVKFREYFSAALEIRSAFKLLQENEQLYPDFLPNKKGLGLVRIMAGTIPDKFQWAARLVGLEPDIAKGRINLEMIINHETDTLFRQETLVIYSYVLAHILGEQDNAFQLLKEHNFPLQNNLLSHYVLADIALRSGNNDEAIRVLEARPKSERYFHFPQLFFLQGLGLLHKLDPEAGINFAQYLDQHKGDDNVKNALQKQAWHHLVHNDTSGYLLHMNRIQLLGRSLTDADKQAEAESLNGFIPDVRLLKARLLFDGGYYKDALKQIQWVYTIDMVMEEEKIELVYRKGRIYDELEEDEQAITNYNRAIKLGTNKPWYFAANAALHLGYLYEKNNEILLAEENYQKCLSMTGHTYKNSIDQRAKAALQRLKEQQN